MMMEGFFFFFSFCVSAEHIVARQRLMFQSLPRCIREVTDIIQVLLKHEADASYCFSKYLTC